MYFWQLVSFLALRIIPFRVLRRFLGNLNARRGAKKAIPIERLPWALEVSKRYLPPPTCLVQAVVAQVFYSTHGIHTDLHFGVRKRKEKLKAHAWLESDGKIFVGDIEGLEQYIRLFTMAGIGEKQKPR